MRIGLIRHFPVEEPLPTGWKTAAELIEWRQRYDQAETAVGTANLGEGGWKWCQTSDLPRATITAKAVFSGDVKLTDQLREAEFALFQTGRLRLPMWIWKWIFRFAWLTGHQSQRNSRDEFRRRVLTVADQLCTMQDDTLVVSHAGMMLYLSAELRRRGFAGPKFKIAEHATVYTFEK